MSIWWANFNFSRSLLNSLIQNMGFKSGILLYLKVLHCFIKKYLFYIYCGWWLMFQKRPYTRWSGCATKAIEQEFSKYITGDIGHRYPGEIYFTINFSLYRVGVLHFLFVHLFYHSVCMTLSVRDIQSRCGKFLVFAL